MMHVARLIPAFILLLVCVASLIVLQIEQRRQRVQKRLHSVLDTGVQAGSATQPAHTILLTQRKPVRFLGSVKQFFRVPIDMPLAEVMPAWLVLMIGAMAGFAAALLGRLYFSWPLSAIDGLVTACLVARGLFGWERNRYATKLQQQLPDAIEMVVSATHAGLPVSESFRNIAREMAAPIGPEFQRIVKEIALGAPPEEPLLRLYRRTGVSEYAIFAVTLGVQSRSGGRLAETIRTLADTIRQRLAIAGKAKALAGEAKLSAYVLAVLPPIAGTLMSFIQPGFLQPLFHDPRGQHLLFIGIVTLSLGIFTMRHLIKGATKE